MLNLSQSIKTIIWISLHNSTTQTSNIPQTFFDFLENKYLLLTLVMQNDMNDQIF